MLEAIFVQRQQLVEHLIELVEDSCNSQNKHFRLLVGMRGIGKTHTVALLYHRLQEKTELQDKLLIAWLKEEEWGVSSWLDLLLRIFQALEQKYTVEYHLKVAQQIEELYQLPVEQATAAAEAILKEFIADKTLLLLTENLDEIFNGLGDLGQKQFRAFLQNHNLITIVATSQNLFNGVSKKDAAFYGFFTPEYLKKLTIPEATNLLEKIAETRKDTELASFIQSTTGKDRIKAIHHLAGGNHRVYIIFSQFLTRKSLDELVQPVMQTLDELTPYYQARMQWLSPQQRKIVELLCDTRNPITVKEIARKCFITHQTASSQLKDLRKKGYVVTVADIPTGRESYYELQEPLMRICLEVKKQRGEPIKLFIDFLRIWYTKEELEQRLETLPQDCLEREYIDYYLKSRSELIEFKPSYDFQDSDDDVLEQAATQIEMGNFEEALGFLEIIIKKYPSNSDLWVSHGVVLENLGLHNESILSYDKAIEIKHSNYSAWYYRGIALENLGKLEEAAVSYDKAIKIQPKDKEIEIEIERYSIWLRLGYILVNLGKFREALESYERAIEIKIDSHEAWSKHGWTLSHLGKYEEGLESYHKAIEINSDYHLPWSLRGLTLLELGRYEEAIASFNRAIEIRTDFYETWYGKGLALRMLSRYEEAIASFDKAIKTEPNKDEAWTERGIALDNLGKLKEAIVSFDKAIKIKPNNGEAWSNRGNVLSELGRLEEAIESFDEALKINPDNYESWLNRGNVLSELSRLEEAIASFDKAIEIKPNFYQAWSNRGNVLSELGRLEEAIASFDKAIEIKPDCHQAWSNRGFVLQKSGKLEEALLSFDNTLKFKPDCSQAHLGCIEPILKLNRWQEGFQDLDKALNRFQDSSDSYKGDTTAYIKIIWGSTTDIAVWKTRLQTLVETYAKYDLAGELTRGITNHIPTLMSDMVSDKAARSWLEIWQEIAGDKPELSIALRFLKTAVEYKETKGDRKVLLQLAKEERELIEELLVKAED